MDASDRRDEDDELYGVDAADNDVYDADADRVGEDDRAIYEEETTYGDDVYDHEGAVATPEYREHTPDDSVYDDDAPEGYPERFDEEDDGYLGETLVALLIAAGVILFLFPEPVTSTLGIILIGIGVVAWLADLFL